MKKLAMLGAGITMLIVGGLHLFSPQMMMHEPGIELTTINHLHVIRAAYGGAYLGIATLFLLGLIKLEFTKFSLISIIVLFSGFALGRIFSIVVDGIPVNRYLIVLGVEILFVVLSFVSLKRQI